MFHIIYVVIKLRWKNIVVRPETHKLLEKMKRKGFNSFNEVIFYCVKVCRDGTKGSIIRLSEMEAERIPPSEFAKKEFSFEMPIRIKGEVKHV